jgi:hypothetical protein
VLLAIHGPLRQSLHYHQFADGRSVLGMPNFVDVASNLPFLIVGVACLWLRLRGRVQGMAAAWLVFFAGVSLVSAGSAWYHLQPDNDSLVWDRLPMTVGFKAVGTTFWPKCSRFATRNCLPSQIISSADMR